MNVADQQILAAWVGAGAAVVQAVGAILAIGVSIHLARSSDKRAREAEQASLERAEAAEKAADLRAQAAEAAAAVREYQAKMDVHNGIVDRIVASATLVVRQGRENAARMAVSYSGTTGTYTGSVAMEEMAELAALIGELRPETADVGLLKAMRDLREVSSPRQLSVAGGDAYVEAYLKIVSAVEAATMSVAACRRKLHDASPTA